MESQKELDNTALLELISRYVIGLYELAEMTYTSHLLGYPGTLEKSTIVYMNKNIQSLNQLKENVNDIDINTLLSEILVTLRLLVKNDNHMKIWVEGFTGKSMNTIRKATGMSIQKRNQHGEFLGKSSLPAWVSNSKYEAFTKESLGLLKRLVDAIGRFFVRANNISKGTIKNWAEEQKTRFQYIG